METTPSTDVRGFAVGELVVLRPVAEADLPGLALLLAANPSEPDRQPWTHQRLKKKFEDEKKPGLWEERMRVFAILRKPGGELVGYLRERRDWTAGVYWNCFHCAENLPDRSKLMQDALRAYVAFKVRWHDPLRISFEILDCEEGKAESLNASGFALELTHERSVYFAGQPRARLTYSWLSDRLLASLKARGAEGLEPFLRQP